jgi:hypothetical protein
MNRQDILDHYQEQIDKAESKLEASGLQYQCKQHLTAFDNGQDYKTYDSDDEPECFMCGS